MKAERGFIMKKAVHFGAGKIGCGFIGDLLHDSGYEIVFADVVQAAIDNLNATHDYRLFLINHDYQEKVIDHISALNSVTEPEKVAAAIADADILTTSVMASNLGKVAPVIAQGLKKRLMVRNDKLIVMACENAIMGTDILKKELMQTGVLTSEELEQAAVYPNTAVDRMVFSGKHGGHRGIEVSDSYELAVEQVKLPEGNKEPIRGAEYVAELEPYLQRKIYIINGGHAISAYLGKAQGKTTVQDVLHDSQLLPKVRGAMLEAAAALEKMYGFPHQKLVDYMEKLMVGRFTTPGVSDPVERVGREPIRKLSPQDRIMGPALKCQELGLPNDYLLQGAASAFHFTNSEDQQAVELQDYIQKNGIEAAIERYTTVSPESSMFNKILQAYQKI